LSNIQKSPAFILLLKHGLALQLLPAASSGGSRHSVGLRAAMLTPTLLFTLNGGSHVDLDFVLKQ
jgi:hypothetical protein